MKYSSTHPVILYVSLNAALAVVIGMAWWLNAGL